MNGREFRLIQEGFPGITSTITIDNGTLTSNQLNLMADTAGEPVEERTGTGIINLNGGVLAVNRFNVTAPAPAGQSSFTINLNGGTLRARNTNANFLNALPDTRVLVKAGGAVIDTNNFTTTIAAPLLTDPALGATLDGGLNKINAGTLVLTSPESTYTGGTRVNQGTLTINHDGNLGAPSGGLTFTGTANVNVAASITSARPVTVPSGVLARFQLAPSVTFSTTGKLSGVGTLEVRNTNANFGVREVAFLGTDNDFTGRLGIANQNADQQTNVTVNSLGDVAGAENIAFSSFSGIFPTFSLGSTAISSLTLNHRQIELAGTMGTTGAAVIANNNATHPLVINTPLLITGTAGARRLTLNAVAGPVNVFDGDIADGVDSPVSVAKGNSAGAWTLSGDNSFTGGVTINGTTAGSQLNVASPTALGTGTLAFSGGGNGRIDNTSGAPLTLTTNNPQTWGQNFRFEGTHSLNLGTGAVSLGAASREITVVANTLTVGGVIGAADAVPGLRKLGNGTLELAAANTYQGPTRVSFGTLLLPATGSLHADSAVTVDNFGILAGAGTVNGSVTVTESGKIAPGVGGAGVLAIGGGLDLAGMAADTFGQLNLELGALAGPNDRITVGGTLVLGDGVFGLNDLNLTDLGGLQAGTYTLISAGAVTGTLDPTDSSGVFGAFGVTLQATGNSLQLVVAEPISGGDSFANWIAVFAVGGQNGLNDDPDGDGIRNALEYVFGTDPTVATRGVIAQGFTGSTFTFTHPQNPDLGDDVVALYRWSKDLATFRYAGESDTGTTVTFSTQADTPTAGITTVTATLAGTVPSRFFVDVEVSPTPAP